MISSIRNGLFYKWFCGFFALYLFNISVDTEDLRPDYIPEDLSINDQESVIEIVVEQLLGFEEAIKEYDDHDTEDHNKKKNVKIDFLVDYLISTLHNSINPLKKEKRSSFFEGFWTNIFLEVDSPPPNI